MLVIFVPLLLHSQIDLKAETLHGTDSSALTFESFLQYPPIITNAIFEEDIPEDNSPSRALPQANLPTLDQVITCQLRYEGDNYLVAVIKPDVGGSGGKFNDIRWGTVPVERTYCISYADDKTNPKGIPPFWRDVQVRYRARRFLNLGFYEVLPGHLTWIPRQHRFTATCDTPSFLRAVVETDANGSLRTNWVGDNEMTVELKYENGVPVMASGRLTSGITFVVIYKYRQDFYAGRLPIEFTRYFDQSRGDDGRAYTIRVKVLEIAANHIPIEEFDPHQVLRDKFSTAYVWTNGVRFRETDAGALVKTPTLAEVVSASYLPGHLARSKNLGFRVAILLFLLLPIFYLIYKRFNPALNSTLRTSGV